MKIAMLGHKRIPSREGGIEVVVSILATEMVKRGHKVTAYNRKGKHVSTGEKEKSIKEYNGVKIITIPTLEKKSLNALVYSILGTIRACFSKYDVLHFHAEGICCMLWLPYLLHKRTVVTIHGLDWQRSKWGGFATKFLLHCEKCAVKYADEIIVLSQRSKSYFWDTYKRETTFIPNGIDKMRRREADIITKKYGLQKDSYILFLARLVPEKGAHYLVEAMKGLKEQGLLKDKKLVITGGTSHSKDYVEELNRLIDGDPDILLTGFAEGYELDELYSNAYVYVLPSDIEGMPISLLEAMSYGACCLVSDIPENADVIKGHALFFKTGDAKDLQLQLGKILNDEEMVNMYREKASEYICEKYKWENIVDETLQLYEKGLKK